MNNTTYRNQNTIIFDFNKLEFKTSSELLSSSEFAKLLCLYIEDLKDSSIFLYNYVTKVDNYEQELCVTLRKLLVLSPSEINNEYCRDLTSLERVVHGIYDFYKAHNRYLVTSVSGNQTYHNFVNIGDEFGDLVLKTYRKLTENLRGRKNNIYRQLQAGVNASVLTRVEETKLPAEYNKIKDVEFIDTLVLTTPLILHSKSNKRTGMFTETDVNPSSYFDENIDDFYVFPAKVGSLVCYLYFHKDFIGNAIALSNLFEFSSYEECQCVPDLIVLFGVHNDKNETVYYHDKENDIFVGSISYGSEIDYFGYMKKMCLTLHNLKMMTLGNLPIHGAFVDVYLKNGNHKSIMLMGDSGAGKSETIEALQSNFKDQIANIDIIFDDMGTIKIEDGVCYGYGTEIGAFIRLDDLDEGTPYRDIDRSIFMNVDQNNARVVLPVASYELINKPHKIDMLLYANNYTDKEGIEKFAPGVDIKLPFVEGKRMALGTTDETGITTTYFANPFGPMQEQDKCEVLIDNVFEKLTDNNVFIGEAYTHLGFDSDSDSLKKVAEQLIEFIND